MIVEDEFPASGDAVRRANSKVFDLAEKGDIPALVLALRSPLESDRVAIRATALTFLGRLRASEAVAEIVPLLLHDTRADVRAGAAIALGRIGGDFVVEQLVHALHDAHPGVRVRAAEALGATGSARPEVAEALVGALDDPSAYVRRAAVGALANSGILVSVREAVERLREDPSWRVRRAASKALKLLGGVA
jgi:HEAT repeat protein